MLTATILLVQALRFGLQQISRRRSSHRINRESGMEGPGARVDVVQKRDGCDSCLATATNSPATSSHKVPQKRGQQNGIAPPQEWTRLAAERLVWRVQVWHRLEAIIDSCSSQSSHIPEPVALDGSSHHPTLDVKVRPHPRSLDGEAATDDATLVTGTSQDLRVASKIRKAFRESGYSEVLRCPPPLGCGRRMGAERGKDRQITSFSEMLRTNSFADRGLESCCTRVVLRWLSRE